MSSPSRQVIDPLICSYSENAERRPQMSLSSSGNNINAPTGKLLNTQATSLSWTPLVSRTFNNEFASLNTTPSAKLFSTLCKPGGPGQQQQLQDADFGLNLTPFLTHNMNLLANPNSAGNVSVSGNFTPYYDKSMHMADFFMDSPIRQTPRKRDAITPSRFDFSEESTRLQASLSVKKPVFGHNSKRAIAQIDTPAKQPTKKFDKNGAPEKAQGIASATKKYAELDTGTPSKRNVLRATPAAALNKTPLKPASQGKSSFLTPAQACPVSSPSTVIMSSAVKTPALVQKGKSVHPPSPTPHKDRKIGTEPVMGIFSERKPRPSMIAESTSTDRKPGKKTSASSKFQIVFTDVHTLMNSKKKKQHGSVAAKQEKKPDRKRGRARAKTQGQGQMQNVHSHSFVGQCLDPVTGHSAASGSPAYGNQQGPPPFHQGSSFSMSQDYNTSIGSCRDFSLMHNSTGSSNGANMSTADHASFDLMHGGLNSTPNGKFLLDHLFEKQSPNVVHQMLAQRLVGIAGDHVTKPTHMNSQPQQEMYVPREYMAPPPKSLSLQQAALRQSLPQYDTQTHAPQYASQYAPQQLRPHQAPLGMNVLMSTPQHEKVMHGSLASYAQEEPSPSDKDSMRFLYQQLHQYQPAKSPHESQAFTTETADAGLKAQAVDVSKTFAGQKQGLKKC